jgi:ribosomal protein S14
MAHSSNSEPRRFWSARQVSRDRARCAACGARASYRGSDVSFCRACLDWARQGALTEWDELGDGD